MTDNNTQNTTQQENTTQPEGNGPAGKMFTQEEVNTIVRERLARERAKGTTTPDAATNVDTDAERKALEADRQQLIRDRQTFECEQYCKENGLDSQVIGQHPGRDRTKSLASRLCGLPLSKSIHCGLEQRYQRAASRRPALCF